MLQLRIYYPLDHMPTEASTCVSLAFFTLFQSRNCTMNRSRDSGGHIAAEDSLPRERSCKSDLKNNNSTINATPTVNTTVDTTVDTTVPRCLQTPVPSHSGSPDRPHHTQVAVWLQSVLGDGRSTHCPDDCPEMGCPFDVSLGREVIR